MHDLLKAGHSWRSVERQLGMTWRTVKQLADAATPEEFARRLGEFARTLEPGEWITGGDWDHELWGGTLPERAWFDSVTPDNPVFVQRLDGHMAVANSAALRAAGVTATTADVEGGTIVRDADGEPTGLLKDEAMGLVYRAVPPISEAQADSALSRAMAWAASKGVTTVAAVSVGPAELAALDRAHARGELTTRVAVYRSIGAWRSDVWDVGDAWDAWDARDDGAEPPRPAGHLDRETLVSFAREHRARVWPTGCANAGPATCGCAWPA